MICATCGWTFTPTHWRDRYCSDLCRHQARGMYPRPAGASKLVRDRCRECGVFVRFAHRQMTLQLCGTCRPVFQQATDRRKNTKRRGARRNGPVDNYTLREIAERDGHRCHICKRKVDMALGGFDHYGPTIDHLIPIVAGGRDTRDNVRLAHRLCNCLRQDGGEVQLLLVG